MFLFLWLVNIIFLLFVFWVRRVEGDNIRGFLGFVDIGIRGFELIMEEVFVKNVMRNFMSLIFRFIIKKDCI